MSCPTLTPNPSATLRCPRRPAEPELSPTPRPGSGEVTEGLRDVQGARRLGEPRVRSTPEERDAASRRFAAEGAGMRGRLAAKLAMGGDERVRWSGAHPAEPAPQRPAHVDAVARSLAGELTWAGPGGAPRDFPAAARQVGAELTEGLDRAARRDYVGAAEKLRTLDQSRRVDTFVLGKDSPNKLTEVTGRDVIAKTRGEDTASALDGVRAQVDFLAQMQAAGVTAAHPPTGPELERYFATLKGKPDEARAAFSAYAKAFHHNDGTDVTYSKDPSVRWTAGGKVYKDERAAQAAANRAGSGERMSSASPKSYDEVLGRPTITEGPNTGKIRNDCEGHAFLAEKLLGAAGFRLDRHVTADLPGREDHALVALRDPKGGTIVVSNGQTYGGKRLPALLADAVKDLPNGEVLAAETRYFGGKTAAEAGQAAQAGDRTALVR